MTSTRSVRVGPIQIGGGAPITVQSMTSTDTRDVAATVAQIRALEEAGCELIRVAVHDMEAAEALGPIKSQIPIPLIADIHFDYRLALAAAQQGVDKLRINPGNLAKPEHVEAVAATAKERGIPIRIGVNAGSVPEKIRAKHERDGDAQEQLAAAMVETALGHVELLERLDFTDIVVSLKAFDLRSTWLANRLFREQRDYPLHLGITEAGLPPSGIARSAIGIATLLREGIGETIRVSLTGDPVLQVRVGREILSSLELGGAGITLVTCPTCGRCELDLAGLAHSIEEKLRPIDRDLRRERRSLRVAVMGCVVNGPGEARDADVGVAGGASRGVVFVQGKPVGTFAEGKLVDALVDAVQDFLKHD
ncbi:MAG: flavodoxin-dependent (E)-4-hydroxy-3-methylbut-2-enyl-diphosphate synthase [Armatimonadetes bacterium]|nr:flavodoxin-dependent (E)-4-hydroxy-3-methylbut-2-enyl-diphosphate synthase [Armatimonadota bacterium]